MDRSITPIAYIKTDFPEKFGVPRQSSRVNSLVGEVIFLPEYSTPEAFRGIEEFSHLWLIFDFSLSHTEGFSPTVRPPRLGGNTRVGVFATRSPFRPNSLGLSSVKLLGVEKRGDRMVLSVSGIDLVDQTPIYDVKPYIPYCDSHADAVGSYADLHSKDKISVRVPKELLEKLPPEKAEALIQTLEEDPRPSYQDQERVYKMSFAGFRVEFSVLAGILNVTNIEELNK